MKLPVELFCSPASKGFSHSSLDYHQLIPSRVINNHNTKISINAATKNVVVSDTVFGISDDDINLSVGMLWNSSDQAWRFASAARLAPRAWASSTIRLSEPDGRELSYQYDKSIGAYVGTEADKEGNSIIKINQDGSYERILTASGTHEVFNVIGQLIEKRSSTGKKICYSYNSQGDLELINLPSGRQLRLQPDSINKHILNLDLVDKDNNVNNLASYELTDKSLSTRIGDLLTRYEKTDKQLQIKANDEITTLSFGADDAIETITEGPRAWKVQHDKKNNQCKISDDDANCYEVGYDSNKHLHSFKLPTDTAAATFDFNSAGQLEKLVDLEGKPHKISYDPSVGLVNELSESNNQRLVQYSYNIDRTSPLFGLKLAAHNQDGKLKTTRLFVYNDKRQCIYEISPAGRITRNVYDDKSSHLIEKQQVVTKFYDGQLYPFPDLTMMEDWWQVNMFENDFCKLQITKTTYDQYGRENGSLSYAEVNEKGEGKEDCNDNHNVTSILDEVGNVKETQIANLVTMRQFDKLNRVKQITEGAQTSSKISQQTSFTYEGRTTTITHPNQLSEKLVCDTGGLLEQKTQTDGIHSRTENVERNSNGSKKVITRADGLKEHHFCDGSGRLRYKILPSGEVTELLYDKSGHINCQKTYSLMLDPNDLQLNIAEILAFNEDSLSKYCFYDDLDQLRFEVTAKKNRVIGVNDPVLQGFITEYKYVLGNKVEATEYSQALNAEQLDDLSYTSLCGSVQDKIQAKNRVTRYFYDADDLKIGEQELVESKDQGLGYVKEYTRDGAGNITHEIVYLNKSKLTTSLANAIPDDRAALITRHWYDNIGRLIATLDADGYLKSYNYNANGKPRMEVTYAAKQLNIDLSANTIKLPVPGSNDKVMSYEYDDLGRVCKINNSQSQLRIDIAYDIANHEISRTMTDLKTNKSRSMIKEYNNFGDLVRTANARESALNVWSVNHYNLETGLTISKTNSIGNTTLFYYDKNRRPRYEISAEGVVRRYSYDPICGKPTEIYQYYNRLNQDVLAVLQADDKRSGFAEEGYFANALSADAKDSKLTRAYDGEGLLIFQSDPNGAKHDFYYNGFDELEIEIHDVDASQRRLRIDYQHDLRGNVTESVQDPDGVQVRASKRFDDALNRVTEIKSQLGDAACTIYEGLRKQTITADEGRRKITAQDAFGRDSLETDWTGVNVTKHEYDDINRSHTIRNPASKDRDITEVSNAHGEVEQITQNGANTILARDDDGNVKKTIFADGSCEENDANTLGLSISQKDRNGIVQQIKRNKDNQTTRIIDNAAKQARHSILEPDSLGLNSRLVQADGLVKNNESNNNGLEQVTVTDPGGLGLYQAETYNLAGGLKRIVQGDTKNENQYQENIGRDILNRETERSIYMGEDKDPLLIKRLELDAVGHVVSEVDGKGNTKWNMYDARGNLRFAVDAEGFVVERQYDVNGRQIKQRSYINSLSEEELKTITDKTSPAAIKQILKADPNDAICHTVYDEDGLPCYEINMLETKNTKTQASIVEKRYDGNRKCVSVMAYATAMTYPDDGIDIETTPTLAQMKALLSQDKFKLNKDNRRTDFSRNKMGKRGLKRDPDGYVVEKRYDASGRVVARIHYSQKFTQLNFDEDYQHLCEQLKSHPDDRCSYYIYDDFGNLRFEIDGEGFVIEHTYDKGNRQTDEFHYYFKLSDKLTVSELSSLTNQLDKDGVSRDNTQILKLMDQAVARIKDEKKDVHISEEYDIAGRTKAKLDGEVNTKGERNREVYELNSLGLNKKRKDKRGNEWAIKFDKAKRPVKEISPKIEITQVQSDLATSALSIQKKVETKIESITSYDASSNATGTTIAANIEGQERAIEKTYDKNNRYSGLKINNVTLDDGSADKPEHDKKLEMEKNLQSKVVYDFNGREIVKEELDGTRIFTVYDRAGRERFKIDGRGCVTEFVYENAFQQYKKSIRHETRIDEATLKQHEKGFCLEDMVKLYQTANDNDRTMTFTHDHRGFVTSATKDEIIIAATNGGIPRPVMISPATDYTINAFGEITSQSELIDDSKKTATTLVFYDHNGNVILNVSPNGYVTQSTFGMRNIDPGKPGCIELDRINWYKPLRPYAEPFKLTRNQIILQLKRSKKYDIFNHWEYDRRLLPVQETITSGVDFYESVLDASGRPVKQQSKKSVTTKTEYDEEGQIIGYVNDCGDRRYLIRNASGDVIIETEFPQLLDINNNEQLIPVTQHLVNAHHQAIGSVSLAESGIINIVNGRPLISAKPSANDRQSLLLMDNRGNARITQSPEGALKFATFNEFRKMVRSYNWTTGYQLKNGSPFKIQHLHATRLKYDANQKPILTAKLEDDKEIRTCKKLNSFDECEGEGPDENNILITWKFDKAGNCWYTNDDKGTPNITFHNARGDEVVHFRAGEGNNLSDYQKDQHKAVSELLTRDYANIFRRVQRTLLRYDLEHTPIQQHLPWYRTKKKHAPQNVQMAFTVVKDEQNQAPYIIFPSPEQKLLVGEFRLRIKGEKEWKTLPITMEADFWKIDLSGVASDEYEYKLDFYFKDPDKEKDHTPSFRAEGNVTLDTGYNPANKTMWYMEDEKTLILTGKADEVLGVELIQDGKPVKRIAVTRTENGRATIDLSNEASGDYEFKWITGGQEATTESVSITHYQPAYKFNSPTTVEVVNGSLPPEISTLIPRYVKAAEPILERKIGFGANIEHMELPPGSEIPGVFLYGADQKQTPFFLGHLFPYLAKSGYGYHGNFQQLPLMVGDPFFLVRSTASEPLHAIKIGNKIYSVQPWANNSYIIKNPDPAMLGSQPPVPVTLNSASTTDPAGRLSIRTGQSGSKMVAREIRISDLKVDRYIIGGAYMNKFETERPISRMNHYEWKTNIEPNYMLRISQNGIQAIVTDLSKNTMPGAVNFQALLPHPCKDSPGPLTYEVILPNGDIVPMGFGLEPRLTPANAGMETLEQFIIANLKFARQHLDTTNYQDRYTLYFSPLPPGATQVFVEYADKTFTGKREWRKIEFSRTTNGLAISAALLKPGINQLRFQVKDAAGKTIDLDSAGWHQKADGWSYGSVLVRKGLPGNRVFVSKNKDDLMQVVKPVMKETVDRYKNTISATDRSGNTVKSRYNLFQQKISETTPRVLTTYSNGQQKRDSLKTLFHYNTRGQQIAMTAPNNGEQVQIVNNHGDVLRSGDADGVHQTSSYDLFHRRISIKDKVGPAILSRYLVRDKLAVEVRTHSTGATEEFVINEEKKCIQHKDRLDHYSYYDFNMLQEETAHIHKLVTGWVAKLNEYDLRTGILKKTQDEYGWRKYWNRNPDEDDKKGIEIDPIDPVDEYRGNIRSHIDLAGQIINYTLNQNKQIVAELGKVNERINKLRGKTEKGEAPPARDIRNEIDEAGHVTDILDDGAHLTTHKRYDKDDYCITNFFIGDDGRTYQATFTDYDEMHRIARIRDTRIVLSIGYDANSNRRFARAYYIDNDNVHWLLRESWFDYSPANRPIVRDGLLKDHKIDIARNQGMKFDYEADLVRFISELKHDTELRVKELKYDDRMVSKILVREGDTGPTIASTQFKRDAAKCVVNEVKSVRGCKVYIEENQPRPGERVGFDMPTYVLSMNKHSRELYDYTDPAHPLKITISDDEKLYEHFKNMDGRTASNLLPREREDLKHAIIDFYIRGNGQLTVERRKYDEDFTLLSEERVDKAGEKDERRSVRGIIERTVGGLPAKEVTLLNGNLNDEDHTPYRMKDSTENVYSLGESPVLVQSTSQREYIKTDAEHDPLPPKAQVHAAVTANNNIKIIEGALPVDENKHSESYRYFVTNSQNCIVYKDSADGRNFYLYAEKRRGEIALMAYFGTITEDFKRQLKTRGSINTIDYPPDMMINIDVNNQPIGAQYPPPMPTQYRTPRKMTYQQVADALGCSSYASAIATANHADASDTVEADATVEIPPVPIVNTETAWNNSGSSIEQILGSLYPTLPGPNIRPKQKQVDFAEEFMEIAVAAAIMACAPELLPMMFGLSLSSLGIVGSALAFGAAGALANTADQLIAIGYGKQKGFDAKSMAINSIASAVSAGVLKGLEMKGLGYQAMKKGFDVRILANNVATAETVSLAQRAVLMGTGVERHLDWRSFAAAGLDAIAATGSRRIFNKDGITDQILSQGTTTFARSLGTAGLYNRRINGAHLAASVLGNMVGSGVGSGIYQTELGKQVARERAVKAHFNDAIANYGQPVQNPPSAQRPVFKPDYARSNDTPVGEIRGDEDWLAAVNVDLPRATLPLGGKRYGDGSYALSEMNRERLGRWQKEPKLQSKMMQKWNNSPTKNSGSSLKEATKLSETMGFCRKDEYILDKDKSAKDFARKIENMLRSQGSDEKYSPLDTMDPAGKFLYYGAELVLTIDTGLGLWNLARSAVGAAGRLAFSLFKEAGQVARVGGERILKQTGAGSFFKSADEAYEAIRASTTDIGQISANTGIKISNIEKVKNHLFHNGQLLDRYVDYGVPAELRRFDSDLSIANAWKRLESGNFINEDIQLLKHETAEAWYMRRNGPGYTAAHDAAHARYPAPNFDISDAYINSYRR